MEGSLQSSDIREDSESKKKKSPSRKKKRLRRLGDESVVATSETVAPEKPVESYERHVGY